MEGTVEDLCDARPVGLIALSYFIKTSQVSESTESIKRKFKSLSYTSLLCIKETV